MKMIRFPVYVSQDHNKLNNYFNENTLEPW